MVVTNTHKLFLMNFLYFFFFFFYLRFCQKHNSCGKTLSAMNRIEKEFAYRLQGRCQHICISRKIIIMIITTTYEAMINVGILNYRKTVPVGW